MISAGVQQARRPLSAGFTLIELVVALSVATLVLATAPAALDRLYDAMVYRSAVRNVLTELKAARLHAARTGRPVDFVFDVEARNYGIRGKALREIPERLQVSTVVATSDVFPDELATRRFYPDGSSTGGSLQLMRSSGQGVRLRVDWLLGRVTQELPVQ